MVASLVRFGLVVLFVVACGGHEPDACERALARIARIEPMRSHPPPAKFTRDALEQCRHGKFASYDPVLRCAMDSDSDATAEACIDAFDKRVMGPGPYPPAPSGPQGINPLLDP